MPTVREAADKKRIQESKSQPLRLDLSSLSSYQTGTIFGQPVSEVGLSWLRASSEPPNEFVYFIRNDLFGVPVMETFLYAGPGCEFKIHSEPHHVVPFHLSAVQFQTPVQSSDLWVAFVKALQKTLSISPNWNREGAHAPSGQDVQSAIRFVDDLRRTGLQRLPHITVGGDSGLGLLWRSARNDADIIEVWFIEGRIEAVSSVGGEVRELAPDRTKEWLIREALLS